jgi:hypothetical protein
MNVDMLNTHMEMQGLPNLLFIFLDMILSFAISEVL